MSEQNVIERVMTFPVPLTKVWAAIGTPEGISQWFSDRAEFEAAPDQPILLDWDEYGKVPGLIERSNPPHEFAFRWKAYGGRDTDQLTTENSTLITFTLEEIDGGTRLTMRETGFATLASELHGVSRPEHVRGWEVELGELATYLSKVAS